MSEHVQIGDVSPRIQYSGDGVVNVFSYPFPIFENVDINVYLNTELQDGGYSVTGAGSSAGGTVRFDQAPAAGITVTLSRHVPEKRTTDFQDGGAFRAKVINEELDRIVCMVQQIREDVGRSVVRPTTSTSGASLALPDPVAGKSLKWSAAGDALVNSDVDPDGLASAVTDAGAARDAAQAAAGDAATSETHAAASALSASNDAAAVASALANITEDVVSISTDTVLTGAAAGDLYVVDCSASDVIVTLPLAATVIEPWTVRVKKVDGTANKVLVRRQGTDTIDGEVADFEIKAENGGARFAVDLDKSPDNWESLAFGVAVGDATPVGTLAWFTGLIPPVGWIIPNGTVYNRATYPDLWAHASTSQVVVSDANWLADPNQRGRYSRGDEVSTFRVPDLISHESFIRAADPTGGFIGYRQADAIKSHAHGILTRNGSGAGAGNEPLGWHSGGTTAAVNPTAVQANGDTETRPKSTRYVPIIKAFNVVTNQAQVEMGQVVQDVAANSVAIANLAATAYDGTVALKSTRTVDSTWGIVGLTPYKPVYLGVGGPAATSPHAYFYVVSGSLIGQTTGAGLFALQSASAAAEARTSPSCTLIPTGTTLTLQITALSADATLYAYQ